MASKRGDGTGGVDAEMARFVATFLTKVDGFKPTANKMLFAHRRHQPPVGARFRHASRRSLRYADLCRRSRSSGAGVPCQPCARRHCQRGRCRSLQAGMGAGGLRRRRCDRHLRENQAGAVQAGSADGRGAKDYARGLQQGSFLVTECHHAGGTGKIQGVQRGELWTIKRKAAPFAERRIETDFAQADRRECVLYISLRSVRETFFHRNGISCPQSERRKSVPLWSKLRSKKGGARLVRHLGRTGNLPPQPKQRGRTDCRQRGLRRSGTGMVLPGGYVLTNAHVVFSKEKNATRVQAADSPIGVTADKRRMAFDIVYADVRRDMALIVSDDLCRTCGYFCRR